MAGASADILLSSTVTHATALSQRRGLVLATSPRLHLNKPPTPHLPFCRGGRARRPLQRLHHLERRPRFSGVEDKEHAESMSVGSGCVRDNFLFISHFF